MQISSIFVASQMAPDELKKIFHQFNITADNNEFFSSKLNRTLLELLFDEKKMSI